MNTVFACFKTYVNYLYRSVLSSNGIISYITQTQHFCESQITKVQNWNSRCDKFVFQKVYLFKHVSQLLPSVWPVSLEYLHHFYFIIFYGIFFLRYLFLFVFVCGFVTVLLLFLFFSLSFPFLAKILVLAVKMQQPLQALTTTAVELNIRTIIVLLLLTLKTIC